MSSEQASENRSMGNQAIQPASDLFYEGLIGSYVDGGQFVERRWLAERIETALVDPGCRFLLLTAGPGAGKSAFLAGLARYHPDRPRYFIRRDQVSPLGSPGARAFLLQIGLQLAAISPQAFAPEPLELTIRQRVGTVGQNAAVIGAEVKRLIGSPFRRAALEIIQEVERAEGRVTGLRVREWVADPHLIPLADLQHLALFDPAATLLREAPEQRIIILVDALDELRYQDREDNLLSWLEGCPEVPANVRFVLTSRPEPLLDGFRRRQQRWLREESIDPRSAAVQGDLRRYALNLTVDEPIKTVLSDQGLPPDEFATQAVAKAEGNFQYLAALFRAIDAAEEEQLGRLLRLEGVPTGLGELYAFFLTLIRERVEGEQVEIPGASPFELSLLPAWEGLYQPILGVLAVALEPLTAEQMRGLAGIRATGRWLQAALGRLGQFLDDRADGRYRLYHATFPEFLTSSATQISHPEYYLEPAEWHRKIAAHYRGPAPTWEAVAWHAIDDYGLRHLVTHLYALSDDAAYRQELYGLICQPLMAAKFVRTYSHRAFAEDVELVIKAAGQKQPPNLVQEVRTSLIYATLGSLATDTPAEVIGVLARAGQTAKALGYTALIQDAWKQAQAYIVIAAALLGRNEVEEAKGILKEALAAAQAARYVGLLGRVARDLTQFGGVWRDVAQSLADQGKAKVLIAIAQTLVELGEFDRAMGAAEAVESRGAKDEVLDGVAQALARAGEFERAMAAVEAIGAESTRAGAMSKVATALAHAGDYDRALAAINAILDAGARADAQIGVAEAMMQARRFDLALALADSNAFRREAEALKAHILFGMGIMGEFDQAFTAVESIEDQAARAYALIGIARGLERAGDQTRAAVTSKQAFEAVQMIPVTEADRYPGIRALALIGAAQAGDVDPALAAVETLTTAADKALALGGVAKALVRAGEHDRAVAVGQRALAAVEASGDDEKAEALVRLTKELAEIGDRAGLNRTVAVIETLADSEAKGRVLGEVAETLIRAGESDRVRSVVEAIEDERAKARALCRVADVLARSGDRDGTVAMADRALGIVEAMPRGWEKTEVSSLAAQALARAGAGDRALAMAKTIADESARANTLRVVARIFVEADEGDRMLAVVERSEDVRWKASALGALAEALADAGNIDGAAAMATRALAASTAPTDELAKAEALIGVANALAQVQHKERPLAVADRALALAQATTNEEDRADVLNRVAQGLARSGAFEQALKVVEMIATDPEKAFALDGIAQALARTGDRPGLNRVLAVAEAIGEEQARAFALGWIALGLAQAGDRSGAVAAANQAVAVAETLRTEPAQGEKFGQGPVRAAALSGVAKALARAGEKERTVDLADRVAAAVEKIERKSLIWEPRALSQAAAALAQVGARERAAELGNRAIVEVEEIGVDSLTTFVLGWIASDVIEATGPTGLKGLLAVAETLGERRAEALSSIASALAQREEKEKGADLVKQTLAAAHMVRDARARAEALSKLTQVLTWRGEQEQAVVVWQDALAAARRAGRQGVFDALKNGATTLAAIDQGQTLWEVYKVVEEVERWWGTE